MSDRAIDGPRSLGAGETRRPGFLRRAWGAFNRFCGVCDGPYLGFTAQPMCPTCVSRTPSQRAHFAGIQRAAREAAKSRTAQQQQQTPVGPIRPRAAEPSGPDAWEIQDKQREIHRLSEYGYTATAIAIALELKRDTVEAVLAKPMRYNATSKSPEERIERANIVCKAASNGLTRSEIASSFGISERVVQTIIENRRRQQSA